LLKRHSGSNRVVVQVLAWLMGLPTFVESSISVLTAGALNNETMQPCSIFLIFTPSTKRQQAHGKEE